MKQKNGASLLTPQRKELSDNPVKLCNEISRLWRAMMRDSDNPEGIMSQPGAHLVLSVLAINDGINQLELVNTTHLRAPTVSVILKNMESEGIVERKSDPKDLRSMRVYLTDFGRKLDKEHIERIKKLDAIALEGISDGEATVLMELLPKIRNNLLCQNKKADKEDKNPQ